MVADSLKTAFEKAKQEQKERAAQDQKCIVCFNYTCTCNPGKGMTPLRPLLTDQEGEQLVLPFKDQSYDCGSGV